ncbi:hypothetical protein [Bradyrhizobium sp.]|jgi:hypothetical protein|uniref:hypothetical protein n=1 Tax=Bradyrhizobium sp. TaxID=376 RepID=UPI002385E874|nr:hypothetical protein [Bradyrhizobium sp.]MDE1934108.1 hypothetical protein [Bradyrhizobium sp.]MDE2065168.1 hypothetical protein [Bradyrhizobium sp.]
MKDLPNREFSPDIIDVATSALHATVNSLPEPASSTNVNMLARFILRMVEAGERDLAILRTTALLELQSGSTTR